jgi:HEAT repeat protein
MEQFFSHVIGLLVAAVVVAAMVTTFYLTSPQRMNDQVARLSVAELKEIVQSLDRRGLPPNGPKKNRLLAALLQLGNGDSEIKERVVALSLQQTHLQSEIGAAARVSLKKLGPKTFPALQEMLESDDPITVGRACSSIYLMGESASSFAPKLIEMVESGDPFTMAAGLLGLEPMGIHALPALEAMDSIILDAHFSSQVSIAKICVGLERDAAPLAKKLAKVYEVGIPSASTWAGIALGAIGPVEDVDTVNLLAARVDHHRQIDKERALLGLALMGVEGIDAKDKVKIAMENPKSRVRPQAAYAYYKITDDGQLPAKVLGELLETPSLRSDALHFLSEIGPAGSSAIPKVLPFLDSEAVHEREGAVIALGSFGNKAAATKMKLLALSGDPDPLIREAVKSAVAAIEKMPDSDSRE